ncbi:Hypothetical protein A7982_01239 [Minicystis rosea]|nr:Hypothetical protein A7982_01239 [Minicystis rosea]
MLAMSAAAPAVDKGQYLLHRLAHASWFGRVGQPMTAAL